MIDHIGDPKAAAQSWESRGKAGRIADDTKTWAEAGALVSAPALVCACA